MADQAVAHDKFLENGRFTVECSKFTDSAKVCHSVELTPIKFGVREVSSGMDTGYKVKAPGHMENMEVTLKFRSVDNGAAGSNADVKKWFRDVKDGKQDQIRADITVKMFKRDAKTEGRAWHLVDCFPTELDYGGQTGGESKMNITTLKCCVGHIDLTGAKGK